MALGEKGHCRAMSLLSCVGHPRLQLLLLCTTPNSLLRMAGQPPTPHPATKGLSQSQGQQLPPFYHHKSGRHL